MASFGFYSSASIADFMDSFPLILMMILFGLGLSIPALWLYKLLFKELITQTIKVFLVKLILALVGALFIWITFYLFDRKFFKVASLYSLMWPGIYTIVLFISTFIFNMNSEPSTDELIR